MLKPWQSPDEHFHRTIAEFLQEWARHRRLAAGDHPGRRALVAARPRDPQACWLVTACRTSSIPSDSRGGSPAARARRARRGARAGRDLPAAGCWSTPRTPSSPSAYGVEHGSDEPARVRCRRRRGRARRARRGCLRVVGGPEHAGVERESIGGQAGSSSLIRNYLGFARGVSGAELAQRAYQQAWVFGTRFLLMREVDGAARRRRPAPADASRRRRGEARARSCSPSASLPAARDPGARGADGAGVFYGASPAEAQALGGKPCTSSGAATRRDRPRCTWRASPRQ